MSSTHLRDTFVRGDDPQCTNGRRPLGLLSPDLAAAAPWVLRLAVVGLYLLLFLRTVWRIGDEGSIVYGAQRVAEGAVPYRDFFEVMGPGAFYWLALWFKVLGTSWITSRVAVLATSLGSAWAIYYITRRQYRGVYAFLPAAAYTVVTVPLWPGANHHFDSNMWVLLAFAASVALPRFDRKTSVIAGLLTGLGATIMPQKGALMLAALVVSAVIDGTRERGWRRGVVHALWLIVPFVGVGLATLVFFWSQDALSDLLYANVVWPATRYHSVNVVPYAYGLRELYLPMFRSVLDLLLPLPLVAIGTGVVAVPLIFIAALPFLAGGQALYGVAAAKGLMPEAPVLPWSYWWAAVALFTSECHRSDLTHLFYGSPLLLIVVTVWIAQAPSSIAAVTRRALVCCVVSLAALLAVTAAVPGAGVETRRGQVHLSAKDDALEFLHQNVRAGEEVFIYPYYPMYYYLANVRNPTRYSILMYHINTPQQFDEVIQGLESKQVKFVLWDTKVAGANLTQWFPGYRDPPADQQRLERYLETQYRVRDVKNNFRILERLDAPVSENGGFASKPG